MTSSIKKGLFVVIALVFVFTFTAAVANAQCGTRGKRPCVTKREKAAAAKRKTARAKIRHRRTAARKPVGYLKAAPPRDANRLTIVRDYDGPVTGDTNYSVAGAPSDPSKPLKPISGGVLNGKARVLPVPTYPAAARAVRAGGSVAVQVLIGENGDVISATAVSGNPLLRAASVAAARGAKFSPTRSAGRL